ncbi:CIC11C00000000322 [Sungouiella intermedia]|uniref:CIC11C00000000322 n=1 Tax=Sungouiella intermedia TaxID=45354 RepID=A0A1L0DFI8_9ASCO|nr:CIC11C00000000322 [[Candida] intermedia]
MGFVEAELPDQAPAEASNTPRKEIFTSESSPWFRRNSFLSQSMIDNENSSVYDSYSFFPGTSSYSIISLKECQGFLFNQDLFATPYQQLRSVAREKRIRALSFSQRPTSKSRSNSSSTSCSSSPAPVKQRRHTSYNPRPQFNFAGFRGGSAVDDDLMDIDEFPEALQRSVVVDEYEEAVLGESDGLEGNDDAEDDDDDDDQNSEEDTSSYGFMSGHYNVRVTDIIVNEEDTSFLPTEE